MISSCSFFSILTATWGALVSTITHTHTHSNATQRYFETIWSHRHDNYLWFFCGRFTFEMHEEDFERDTVYTLQHTTVVITTFKRPGFSEFNLVRSFLLLMMAVCSALHEKLFFFLASNETQRVIRIEIATHTTRQHGVEVEMLDLGERGHEWVSFENASFTSSCQKTHQKF